MGSLSSRGKVLKWVLWTLVIFVVASAILSIAISLNLLAQPPDLSNTADFVDRLSAINRFDQSVLNITLVSNFAGLGVFVVVAMLGVTLRPFAERGTSRDIMATTFLLAGAVGVVAQLMNVGLNQASALPYCDCGYRTEELIGQAKALDAGFQVQSWLAAGALASVGLAAAMAGALIDVSPAWRTLSYAIGVALIVAVVLQLVGQGDWSTIVSGVTAGIFVTIWAIMLARAVPRMELDATETLSPALEKNA